MTQSYIDFPETDSLAESRPLILANDRTIMSCAAGTTFPSGAGQTEIGMLCYRTDQNKLYELTSTSPTVNWALIADLSKTAIAQEDADARYALIVHNHTYDVNSTALGYAGGTQNTRFTGGTKQMGFRTDGTTIMAPNLLPYAYIWQYGGDIPTQTIMGLNSDGTLFTKAYGFLGDRFLSKAVNDTLASGVGLYALDGASSGDAPNGKGKLQYATGRWIVNAGADSSDALHVRRGSTDLMVVANDGQIWSGNYGWLSTAFAANKSSARPGVTALYRFDADVGVYLGMDWDGAFYRLRGYSAGNAFNSEVRVAHSTYSGNADFASQALNAYPGGGIQLELANHESRIRSLEVFAATPSPPPPSPPPAPPPFEPNGPPSCFPSFALVEMFDGAFKPISEIKVGEFVKGRYGEANPVIGLDRPKLGNRVMYQVNREHWTTDDHPHFTRDGIVAIDAAAYYERDVGSWCVVEDANGKKELWLNTGLPEGMVSSFGIGDELVFKSGYKQVVSMTKGSPKVWLPDMTIYNLVVGGSHTFRVDGYLVTAWPTTDDFDYDSWQPKPVVRAFATRPLPGKKSWLKRAISWLRK